MSTSTIVLIFILLISAGFLLNRVKKGKLQEKDIVPSLVIIVGLIVGLVHVDIKYEAIHKIETNMEKIQTNMEIIQTNINIDKNNISTMERNILNVENHISEMEENVKKIADSTTGISREGGRTTIKGGLTLTD